jgi:two-component system heavy metal sensor histidine kinase CusS
MAIRIGFRGWIAAVAAALSLVTLGAAFTAVSFSVNRSQERQFDMALLAVANAEADELSQHVTERIQISDRPGPAANDVGPLPLFGALYAADGAVLDMTATFRGSAPRWPDLPRQRGVPFDFDWQGEPLRGAVVNVPGRHARLLIAASRTDLDGDEAFLRRAMLMVFGVAVAWTVILAVGMATRMTRTHRSIVATAKRVANGDLTARIGPVGRTGEMAALARNIDEMIERLAVLLGSQQQFIAHAAHELRSPLTMLLGELSHASRRSRSPEEYQQAIDQSLRSARKLKDLTEDLLSLARLGADKGAATELVELRRVLDEAIEGVAADAKTAVIVVDPAPSPVTLRGRTGDLIRMFRNLFENAARHAPSGSVVRVGVLAMPDAVTVDVRDEGPGVPEDERERVFEPFFRGAAVRAANQPGAGLGLTIARDIARLHGGDVVLAGASDSRGTRFVVRLPVAVDPGGSG